MEIIMFNLTNTQSKTRGREVEMPLEMMTMNDARGEDGDVSFSFSCLDLVEVLEEILILEVCGGYGGSETARLHLGGESFRRLGFPSLNRYSGGQFRELTELEAEYMPIGPSQKLFHLMKRTQRSPV
jgi:hypothetical protein